MGTHVCVRIFITQKSATCINWNSGDCKKCVASRNHHKVGRGEVENCFSTHTNDTNMLNQVIQLQPCFKYVCFSILAHIKYSSSCKYTT